MVALTASGRENSGREGGRWLPACLLGPSRAQRTSVSTPRAFSHLTQRAAAVRIPSASSRQHAVSAATTTAGRCRLAQATTQTLLNADSHADLAAATAGDSAAPPLQLPPSSAQHSASRNETQAAAAAAVDGGGRPGVQSSGARSQSMAEGDAAVPATSTATALADRKSRELQPRARRSRGRDRRDRRGRRGHRGRRRCRDAAKPRGAAPSASCCGCHRSSKGVAARSAQQGDPHPQRL
eukprot:351347-Chlamydomonas_euryale.AAC.3